MFQDDEPKRLLLEAVERCILNDGTPKIRIERVAKEAGVSRSTVYRYFPNRDDLLVGLLAQRSEQAIIEMLDGLADPADPRSSLVELVGSALDHISSDPVLKIVYQPEEAGLAGGLTVISNALGNVTIGHLEPLLHQWQADGRLAGDLDVTETIGWLLGMIAFLATFPITPGSADERGRLIDRYIVRGLLPGS